MAKSPGDKLLIPANTYNSMVEAAFDYETRRRLSTPINVPHNIIPGHIIKVRNDTGGNLAGGSTLEVGDAILDPLEPEYLWFGGDEPQAAGKAFGILRRPLPDGQIDDLQLTGVVLALVDVQATTDTHASPADGTTTLKSNLGGPAKLLGPTPTATGEQTMAVLLGAARREMWVAYVGGTAITARSGTTVGSGTVTLKHKNGSTIEDVTDGDAAAVTKTVYNWAGTASGTDTYVVVEQDAEGVWWYVEEDCP